MKKLLPCLIVVAGVLCGRPFPGAPRHCPAAEPAPGPRAAGEFNCNDCNILLLSITNLRADHLGTYGYSRKTSPNLDAFAATSLVFERAFSHASWTLPVAVSLLTSRYPFSHGLMNRKNYKPLPPSAVTLVDVLKASGYTTAAFVGDRDYSQAFGHTSRFQHVYDSVGPGETEDWHRLGVLARTVPKAIAWIRQNQGKKFFVFVQGYDVHCPFAVPEENNTFDPEYKGEVDFTKCYWTFGKTKPIKVATGGGSTEDIFVLKTSPDEGDEIEAMFYPEDVRHMVALYDGEILNADRQVGALLGEIESLGLAKKTVVVILSEHGDMMGKYGRFMRGGPLRGTLYDDVLRVPLILRHPSLPPARVAGLVQLIDLAPTLLDIIGLPSPETFAGKSLRPLMVGGKAVNDRILAGSAYTPRKTSLYFRDASIALAVRNEEWKLIHERVFSGSGPRDQLELYRVKTDPDELENLAEKEPAVLADLEKVLDDWLKGIGAQEVRGELSR